MSNVFAIHSVGDSLMTYLRNAYPASLRVSNPCEFVQISSGELLKADDLGTTLSLFLYRVTFNEHLRNGSRAPTLSRQTEPLSLDLHYLLTIWAGNALAEQVILAWAMREIYQHPILDTSLLSAEAGWSAEDTVQIIPAELNTEDMMRIWDALTPTYRLSVPYVARVVRIDADITPDAQPVVATRFALSEP